MEGITTDEGTNDRENPAFLNRRLTEDLKRGVNSATITDKANGRLPFALSAATRSLYPLELHRLLSEQVRGSGAHFGSDFGLSTWAVPTASPPPDQTRVSAL